MTILINFKFRANLKKCIAGIGAKQSDIAIAFNVAASTPSNWILGRSHPNLDLFSEICQYFNTDPTTMLWGDVPDVVENVIAGPIDGTAEQVKDIILGYKVQVQKNNGGNNNQIQTNCTECLSQLEAVRLELAATKEQLIKVQSAYIKLLTGGVDVG